MTRCISRANGDGPRTIGRVFTRHHDDIAILYRALCTDWARPISKCQRALGRIAALHIGRCSCYLGSQQSLRARMVNLSVFSRNPLLNAVGVDCLINTVMLSSM